MPSDTNGAEHHGGDIVDPATGLPRILGRKCDTCIFRPGNLMHLAEGRRDQMVQDSTANDSWIICHETGPHTKHPDPAICRGFHDVHGHESMGIRLAHAMARLQGLVYPDCAEVDPGTTGFK